MVTCTHRHSPQVRKTRRPLRPRNCQRFCVLSALLSAKYAFIVTACFCFHLEPVEENGDYICYVASQGPRSYFESVCVCVCVCVGGGGGGGREGGGWLVTQSGGGAPFSQKLFKISKKVGGGGTLSPPPPSAGPASGTILSSVSAFFLVLHAVAYRSLWNNARSRPSGIGNSSC